MTQPAPNPAASSLLTPTEQQRIGALLSAVTARTLLQSLAHLCQADNDALLIIATLLDRLPSEDRSGDE